MNMHMYMHAYAYAYAYAHMHSGPQVWACSGTPGHPIRGTGPLWVHEGPVLAHQRPGSQGSP